MRSTIIAKLLPLEYLSRNLKNLEINKDSFITQDRNDDFEGGQVESTFSWGHCDLTSGTISNK